MKNPNGRKVLVVNDDLFQLRLTSALLEKDGLNPLPCQSVEEAFRVAAEQGPVDLILTDLYMPDIDGWKFCRMLRSPEYPAFNQIPILVMSATFSGADAEQMTVDLGANAFLSTPCEPSTLRNCVRALMEGRVTRARPKALIVEDSPTQLKLLKQTFEKHDYWVEGAETGSEARRLFQEHAPEVVILDYFLPDTTGDQLLETFKKANLFVVAIMITADQDSQRALHLMRQGADGYVRKPFDPEFLMELCEKVRRERSLLRVEAILEDRTRKLQRSEALYRAVVEDQTEMICRFLPNGTLTFVNEATSRCFGKKTEDLLAHPFSFLLPKKDHDRFKQLLDSLSAETPGKMMETETTLSDGRPRWHQWAYRVILDEEKYPLEFQAVGRDITESKRAEKEISNLEQQFRQSQKMEAVGQLAGGIAHEFNNLMTVVTGYSELLLMSLPPGQPLHQYTEEIRKAGERAASLTQKLLAFSRKQVLQPKVIDVNGVVTDIEKMLGRLIGEDIELITLLTKDVAKVKVDVGQIEQVILNLALNAREAMPDGGKLILETTNVNLDDAYSHTHIGVKPGSYVQLSISDTGTGISPEVMERIFEPFFTTKGKGQRSGLGLSMAYGTIQQSGGSLWVYSEPGHGTTFKIYLPRIEEETDVPSLRAGTDSLPAGNETILLVEDEPSVRDLETQVLRGQGYRVLEASNGVEAVQIAKEERGEIHLLLTDVVMPRMGGKELAEQLKILKPRIKVLLTSGYTDHAMVLQGLADSQSAFIQKPFSLAALTWKVREVLRG